jgi:hypothetical protein
VLSIERLRKGVSLGLTSETAIPISDSGII